ncbi:MAG TPA: hypothetical protein VGG42_19175, partial [Acidobacteriaceae bacterium]
MWLEDGRSMFSSPARQGGPAARFRPSLWACRFILAGSERQHLHAAKQGSQRARQVRGAAFRFFAVTAFMAFMRPAFCGQVHTVSKRDQLKAMSLEQLANIE